MTSYLRLCSIAGSTACEWTPFLLSGCSWHHRTDSPVGNQGEGTCGRGCKSDHGGERSSRCLRLFGRPGGCGLRAYKHTLLASFVFWNMLVIKHTDKIFVNTSRYNLWEWPVSCTWHMLSLWKALHVKLKVREIGRGENRWWWLLVASAK